MEWEFLLGYLVMAVPVAKWVLMALGALLVGAKVYVKLTVTPDDDAKLAAIFAKPIIGSLLGAISLRAPIKPKDE